MASIGHIAVGMAAGRLLQTRIDPSVNARRWMVGLSILSLVPDLDVIGFWLGVEYEDPLGHRGATHSVAFAVIAGLIGAAMAKPLEMKPAHLGLLFGGVTLTHPLLDMLTNGGLGCALWWPINDDRLFFPITPLPVAPIGLGMLSLTGFLVVMIESVFFAPFFLYATWPRKPR